MVKTKKLKMLNSILNANMTRSFVFYALYVRKYNDWDRKPVYLSLYLFISDKYTEIHISAKESGF